MKRIDAIRQRAEKAKTSDWSVADFLSSAGPDIDWLTARHAEMVEALQTIANEDRECRCLHDDEDCCLKVGEFCPHCIAGAALSKADEVGQ